MMKNRLANLRADYLFMIVRWPDGWVPQSPLDVPPDGEILSVEYVASFEEAQDDMLRCNDLALKRDMNKWAVVESGGGEL